MKENLQQPESFSRIPLFSSDLTFAPRKVQQKCDNKICDNNKASRTVNQWC